MRFVWDLRDPLKLKTDADLERGLRNLAKKSVIKSCASTETASFSGESQPGDNNQIELLQARAGSRFADPKSPWYKFGKRGDRAKRKSVALTPRIGDQRMLRQPEVPQKVQVRFVQHWGEQGKTVFAGEKGQQFFANPQGASLSFNLRQLFEAFAHDVPQARFIGKL